MKYDIQWLQKKYNQGERLKYVFFWGHKPNADGSVSKCCFSQWWDCKFTVDGVEYHTAEQYMMAQKAALFGDKKMQAEIMKPSHPKQYKELGRKIFGFDQGIWDRYCRDIVVKGNVAKFSQNEELKAFLLGSINRVLVEASPYDKVWGIGMSSDERDIENPFKWNGTNYLGFCLMEARDIIRGQG